MTRPAVEYSEALQTGAHLFSSLPLLILHTGLCLSQGFSEQNFILKRVQIFTALTMETTTFLDVRLCSLLVRRRFGIIFHYFTLRNVKNFSSYLTGKLLVRHAAAWLVEAICYKPEGRGFYTR
jgi:hypothetical protein